MKISLNWIKKYTEVDLSADDLVAKIGAQLGAVEEVANLAPMYKDIRIVQITEAKPHPNADKLNIYQITDGREQVQVVSGDRELRVGDKVAWLAPGTIVPNTYATNSPVVMEARPLRGELSNGMFGSGKELALNDDHERVQVLDTDAQPGTLFADAYELNDVIIDIENKMFTHRPDCFGLLGVAREIAGIQQQAFASPDWYLLKTGVHLRGTAEALPLHISNEVPALCPAYRAVVLRNVQMGSSPLLFQSYLKRVGIRPISNVVDVTNYLMYLTGQPLHAFDYDKVAAVDGEKHAAIVVRTPRKGETITLLDGRTIQPHADAILICSRHKPIALGGVMGGQETEVDDCTVNVILESATFNMYSIRKTSMEHGIFTDAVTRYSKGQSEQQGGVVLAHAITLMERYAGATLAGEEGFAPPKNGASVVVNDKFLSERLGVTLQPAHSKRLLENVELTVVERAGQLEITPGFWRTDLEIPEDFVEEIGRLQGYDQLPHELPQRSTTAVDLPSRELLRARVRAILADAGNNEAQTYSFVAAKLLERTGQDPKPAYRLRNALSPELQLIRTSLLPSLLDKVHLNHKAGFGQFGLFEIGKSHNKYELGDDQLPRERLGLSYIFSADTKAAAAYEGAPFYQARYELYHVFSSLHVPITLQPLEGEQSAWWLQNLTVLFEPKHAALIRSGEVVLGIVGEFSAAVRRNFKLPDMIAGFELDLGAISGLSPRPYYRPLLRFPAIDQDVCLRVPHDVTYENLVQLIVQEFVADERLRVTISPLDIYQRPEDPHHRQMTFRISWQHHERTLTTEEVNAWVAKVVKRAHTVYKAELV